MMELFSSALLSSEGQKFTTGQLIRIAGAGDADVHARSGGLRHPN
jgi:hypothetical protein